MLTKSCKACGGEFPTTEFNRSGLHVEHNLRVIPRVINQAKGNRRWPDMP